MLRKDRAAFPWVSFHGLIMMSPAKRDCYGFDAISAHGFIENWLRLSGLRSRSSSCKCHELVDKSCTNMIFSAAAYKLPRSDLHLWAGTGMFREGNIMRVMICNDIDIAAWEGLHFLSSCLWLLKQLSLYFSVMVQGICNYVLLMWSSLRPGEGEEEKEQDAKQDAKEKQDQNAKTPGGITPGGVAHGRGNHFQVVAWWHVSRTSLPVTSAKWWLTSYYIHPRHQLDF